MARKVKEIQFKYRDEDFEAFGRYRILYTKQGRKMVNRQRATYIISGLLLALLTTVFHFDKAFTILLYILSSVLVIVGLIFAESIMLRQQDKAIKADSESADRVHAPKNIIRFDNTTFTTIAGDDVQTFKYSDIQKVDFTDKAIYVWLGEDIIMSIPDHAFNNLSEMREVSKWLRTKADAEGEDKE